MDNGSVGRARQTVLSETILARRDVGRERHEPLTLCGALYNAEVRVMRQRQIVQALDRLDHRERGRRELDFVDELFDGEWFAFDVNQDAGGIIQDLPFQRTTLRQRKDKGTKPHALHYAPDQYLSSRRHLG